MFETIIIISLSALCTYLIYINQKQSLDYLRDLSELQDSINNLNSSRSLFQSSLQNLNEDIKNNLFCECEACTKSYNDINTLTIKYK